MGGAMKTIIAGSRSICDSALLEIVIKESNFEITEVVSGGARGVDRLGELWATDHDIPVKRFPANWQQQGKRAGYVRNSEMASYSQALIALWDGESRGTAHMVRVAQSSGLKVFVKVIR